MKSLSIYLFLLALSIPVTNYFVSSLAEDTNRFNQIQQERLNTINAQLN